MSSDAPWRIFVGKRVEKQVNALPARVQDIFFALVAELRVLGPVRTGWRNYGKIVGQPDCHHCHLQRGRPTYVAVWRVTSGDIKAIEVTYVGTHEDVDYRRACR